MSFAALSVPSVLIGLLALAGLLYLMQRLRVRYREQTVITTLFWKQALEEARARVLVRRFKHLAAYLLVLLIAALMWLGFADPDVGDTGDRDHVILLDGSANMGRGDRFAATVALVAQRVAALPHHRRRVILCADRPGTVLRSGEPALLLEARLADFRPAACPATVDATLQALTTTRETLVIVAGDAAVRQATIDALPEHVRVTRIAPAGTTPANNQGITALGVGRSSSGDYEKVDVLCEIGGAGDDPQVAVSIGGRAVAQAAQRTKVDGRTRLLLADLDASGELLTITLRGGDALAADDTATLRLPKRRRIRVALSPSLDATCGPVLRGDPAVLLTSDNPDVVVRRAGESGADVPTLSFVAIADQREAILLHHDADRSSHDVLLDSFATLGLSEVDAMEVAQSSGRRIELGAAPAARRDIGVWAALLAEPFNLVQSRSFPVFLAQSVRWLADIPADPDFVAVGEPVAGEFRSVTDDAGQKLDAVGAAFVPPSAGVYRAADGAVLAAALTNPATTTPAPTATVLHGDDGDGPDVDLALWLAAAILALLLVEWFLFRTGRMP